MSEGILSRAFGLAETDLPILRRLPQESEGEWLPRPSVLPNYKPCHASRKTRGIRGTYDRIDHCILLARPGNTPEQILSQPILAIYFHTNVAGWYRQMIRLTA